MYVRLWVPSPALRKATIRTAKTKGDKNKMDLGSTLQTIWLSEDGLVRKGKEKEGWRRG